MKKVVLNVEFRDDKIQTKAMKTISGISGVESLSVDKKDKKFTIIGDVDPVKLVGKLRKLCHVQIVSVGPAKEEKKDETDQLASIVKAYDDAHYIQPYPYCYYI